MPEENARKIFSENLKKLLDEKRIQQKDLAEYLGVSDTTVSDWIKMKKFPRVDKMQRIADYFDVEFTSLYSSEHIIEDREHTELFRLAQDASPQAVRAAIAMLRAMKGEE